MPARLQQEESRISISIKPGAATRYKELMGLSDLQAAESCWAGQGLRATGGDAEAAMPASAQHGVQLEGPLRPRSGCLVL